MLTNTELHQMKKGDTFYLAFPHSFKINTYEFIELGYYPDSVATIKCYSFISNDCKGAAILDSDNAYLFKNKIDAISYLNTLIENEMSNLQHRLDELKTISILLTNESN